MTDSNIEIVNTIRALRAHVDAWKDQGHKVALVPTMGALHDGHLSLVTAAQQHAERIVASIFVNPKQFAQGEDFSTYPRDEAKDLNMLAAQGCHLGYTPTPAQMYPDGYQTSVAVPELAQGLCSVSRPHFFGGVATVVCKLLNQCRPDFAIFGEKDYQQLLIIRRMVRDLDMDVEIIGAPIIREADGLAMSSRNAYLSSDERKIAGRLNKVLADMAQELASGASVDKTLQQGRARLTAEGFDNLDYLEVRSAETLTLASGGPIETPSRLFAAAMVGRTRLIDNWPI